MAASSIIDPARLASGPLSPEDCERYSRHLLMPEVGIDGQKRLRAASVLCIGLGGLGSPATLYLAAAGIGRLGLVDADRVDRSNLQRQILHHEDATGTSKLSSAAQRLRGVNSTVQLDLYDTFLTTENALEIAAPYDVILDGTDNFATRYLSNDLAVLLGKPNVYGSIHRFEGQCSVFAPHLGGPCYRCLFPEPPPAGSVPSCAEAGVLGVLPGIVGSLQALEAIKLILGQGDSLVGRLIHFDALRFRFREIRLRRDPQCPLCGDQPTIRELRPLEVSCEVSPPPTMANLPAMSVSELRDRLTRPDPLFILDVREPAEFEICRLPGSHLIPLGELRERLSELPRDRSLLVHCKSGKRSAEAVRMLHHAGLAQAVNLTGGILAWAEEIDPAMLKY